MQKNETVLISSQGIGGFVAKINTKDEQSLTSIVTDIPVEDGSFLQDHIIKKPKLIRITGVVTDQFIFGKNRYKLPEVLRALPEKFDTLRDILPSATEAQLNLLARQTDIITSQANSALSGAQNTFNTFEDTIGDDASNFISEQTGLTRNLKTGYMQAFHDYMTKCYQDKLIIRIEMPFKTYENMVITEVSLKTDQEADALDFELVAQQIRIAQLFYEVNYLQTKQKPNKDRGTPTITKSRKKVKLIDDKPRIVEYSDTNDFSNPIYEDGF